MRVQLIKLLIFVFALMPYYLKIMNVDVQYYFLFVFYLTSLISIVSFKKIGLVYFIPVFLVFIPFLLKIIFGYKIIYQDIITPLRYINLSIITFFVYNILVLKSLNFVRDFLKIIIKITSVIVFTVSVIGVFQFYFPNIISDSIIRELYEVEINAEYYYSNFEFSQNSMRASSIYLTPIVFSSIVLYLLIIFIVNSVNNSKYYISIIIIFALVLTNVRATLFSLFIISLIYSINLFKIRKVLLYLVFGFIFYLLFTFFISDVLTMSSSERYKELVDFIGDGKIPKTLQLRLNDAMLIWSKASEKNYILSGIPRLEIIKDLKNVNAGFNIITWIRDFGIISSILLNVWFIYLLFYFYKLQKQILDIQFKRFTFSLILVILAGLIMSISQTTLLLARWREILFILFGIHYAFYKKLMYEKY